MKIARCHPERKHYAHGLCKHCYHLDYDKGWRARQPRVAKIAHKAKQPRKYKPATCHPDRNHIAHGLCGPCYGKARYRDPVTGPQIKARNAAMRVAAREEFARDEKAYEAYLAVRREENRRSYARRAALRLQRLRVSGDVESDSGSLSETG